MARKKIPGGLDRFTRHNGKGSRIERLGSRFSRTSLHGGDPMSRSLGDYAKGTPLSGDGDGDEMPFVTGQGRTR